jgi:hypothetical protein
MVNMFSSCASLIGQSFFAPTAKDVEITIDIPANTKYEPSDPPAPSVPSAPCSPIESSNQTAPPSFPALGTLASNFCEAYSRMSQCKVLAGDAEILNSAWDGHSIVSGTCRVAEIAFNDGNASTFSIEKSWVRVAATASFCISLKFNSSYAFDRLRFYMKPNMTLFTTLYYCIFLKSTPCIELESDIIGLNKKIENAEMHIVKRLQTRLFKLLFFTPCNSVEVFLDRIDGIGESNVCSQASVFVRNLAAYATMLSHVSQDGPTSLLRKTCSSETATLVSSAILLVTCEAIALRHNSVEMPRSVAEAGAKELQNKPAVALAVSISLLLMNNGHLIPVVARRHCDVVCKRLIDFDNIQIVYENLSKHLKRI